MRVIRDPGVRRVLGPSLVAALLGAGTAWSQSGERVAVKRLFATPEAVLDGSLSLPDPARGAVASTAAMFTLAGVGDSVEFEHGGGAMRALPIAAPGFRGRLVIGPAVAGRSGSTVSLPVGTFDGRVPRVDARPVALDALGIGAETSLSEFTLPAGRYRISFTGDAGTPVFAALGDASDVALVAHRADAVVRAGEPLAIRIEARRPAAAPPLEDLAFAARARTGTPLPFAIGAARVRFADGSVAEGAARAARDGSVTVSFPPGVAGDALVEISAAVQDGKGLRTRSVALLTRIARAGTRLAATPSISAVADGGWLELAIPVETGEESLVAATEVWAVGPRGERPLGWLGGIAEVEADEDLGPTVRLGVAAARLAIDDSERLEARGLRFHEREGFATLAAVDRIGIDFDREDRSAAASTPAPDADWMGRPGVATVAAGSTSPLVPGPGSHVRGLVHGYCADANAWPAAQFGPEAWAYEAVNQNWPNDTFALDLLARSGQFKSLGVVAHSQGGMAALHLYTFYFSGLDWAGPGRLIQAVGAPFEGTPIAGVLAALGAIFGVQCGANYDMTPEGAAIWLATIPPAPRSKVYTFTTSYTGPGWSGYCSLATALFLAFPEDGVTEHSSGHFPGANDLGLTYGWCHVDGMRDPDQALDASRNGAMREAGAR